MVTVGPVVAAADVFYSSYFHRQTHVGFKEKM
jgi:hypothetical protein